MTSIQEIRAKLIAQQATRDNKGNSGGGDRAMFPFWNAQDGASSTIRLLPDADPNNVYFWIERLVIKLPFQGIKGENDKEVLVQVPCMEMYGDTCPIIAETKAWWKDPSLEGLARKYWKKKSYLFQGFVVNSAVEEDAPPENPIRRFAINTSIFDIIKSSLMNPEMEDLPTDYVNGRDFKLTKTKKGEYANYSTSNWSFKTRSLNPTEQDAIAKFGLFNLRDFLPKKPSPEELEIIKEMFQASVNDEAYDPERWSNHFRPYGMSQTNATTPAQVQVTAPTASKAFVPTIADEDAVDAENSSNITESSNTGALAALAKLQNSRKAESETVTTDSGDKPNNVMDVLRRVKERNATK